MTPLESNHLISEVDLKEIFTNLKEIYDLNSCLLERLQEKIKNSSPNSKVCEEIRKISPLFMIYFSYCKCYESASKRRAALRKEIPEFNEFLTKAEKSQ
jgi:hypothetical protein